VWRPVRAGRKLAPCGASRPYRNRGVPTARMVGPALSRAKGVAVIGGPGTPGRAAIDPRGASVRARNLIEFASSSEADRENGSRR